MISTRYTSLIISTRYCSCLCWNIFVLNIYLIVWKMCSIVYTNKHTNFSDMWKPDSDM